MGCGCFPKLNKRRSRCEEHKPVELARNQWFDGKYYRNHFTTPPLGEGILGFCSWVRTRFKNRNIPKADPARLTVPNLDLINNPPQPQITWLGHATVLVQLGKLNVLVDPCLVWTPNKYYKNFFYAKRLVPSPISISDFPRIDALLITHNHNDHLDKSALKEIVKSQRLQFDHTPKLFVPSGLADWWFKPKGIETKEVGWWESENLNGLQIVATPAQHWSFRDFKMNRSHWCGWLLQHGNCRIYISGDTGYSNFEDRGIGNCQDFKRIKDDYGQVDLAVISVGACYPEWFMCTQHITPIQAVKIHKDLDAKRSVAVHWGTFDLSDEFPEQAVPLELEEACNTSGIPHGKIITLKIGETKMI